MMTRNQRPCAYYHTRNATFRGLHDFLFPKRSTFISAEQLHFFGTSSGFNLGSASCHVHRTLVPSHEGHNKIPLGSTRTQAEYRRLLPAAARAPPRAASCVHTGPFITHHARDILPPMPDMRLAPGLGYVNGHCYWQSSMTVFQRILRLSLWLPSSCCQLWLTDRACQ